MTTPEDIEFLRMVARDAVSATLEGREYRVRLPAEGPLAAPGSCFVTLRRRGSLRGCIGLIGERHPLALAVREAAVRALHDPRFPPPSRDEDADLEIEVSVLGPFRRIRAASEVEIGRHGVHLRRGGRSAIFLPQVAPAQGWDRETLLAELARKAGLPGGAWADAETELSVFEADVF